MPSRFELGAEEGGFGGMESIKKNSSVTFVLKEKMDGDRTQFYLLLISKMCLLFCTFAPTPLAIPL